ncbi:MAG: 4Fe-4S binding protein [Oxalobacteraceae bacterium]
MSQAFFRLCRWATGLLLLVSVASQAVTLKKADVDAYLSSRYAVGDIHPNVPVWPLFARESPDANEKPALVGYAFESVDFEPVRGYGGKPINILVAIDTEGNFLLSRLIDHREPLFRSEAGIAKLTEFASQYVGITVRHETHLQNFRAKTSHDEKRAYLHGVQAGTVTAKAIDRTILQSAASVARAHEDASKKGNILGEGDSVSFMKGDLRQVEVKPLRWEQLLSRRMVEPMTLTRGQIEKAFEGTRAAGADKVAANQPEEVALQFHIALASLPQIGRNLLDDEGWRLLVANMRDSQALVVSESGPLFKMMYESQRVVDDLPFVLKQHGKTLMLRSIAYDKGLAVPGYPTATRVHVLIVDSATPLDPAQAFELNFRIGRRFGTFPNQVAYAEFALPYRFHGWRTTLSHWWDADWVEAWGKRSIDIAVLLAGLVVLCIALLRQRTTALSSRRLKIFRMAYLLFTLGFIGWTAQGQLSIVNITASIDALATGNDLSFLLADPMTVILWIFVGFTLLVWGRGTFCGWLCPFGAFQELVSLIATRLGLKRRRLRGSMDRRLKWLKYLVLAGVIATLWLAPSSTELAAEVEPFKTAISLYFLRDWPYVVWATGLLMLSVFVYRGYCRYICPLGAALAVFDPLRRWGWIARRDACGTPCQTCRHRCEYQSIAPTGKIAYSECFQCLDCVAIYHDDKQCLPLIQERKRKVIHLHEERAAA